MKFRKKPVEIEAMKFETNNDNGLCMKEIECWILKNGGTVENNNTDLKIKTLEGIMRADVGDWIIKGIKGEFYPCKPDVFEMTYETTEEQTAEYYKKLKSEINCIKNCFWWQGGCVAEKCKRRIMDNYKPKGGITNG